MGTSASSNGPGAGVSFDPPWLDDIDIPNNEKSDDNNSNNNPTSNDMKMIAPRARYSTARRSLGDYVRTGSKDSLRRALGNYSKTGMGGANSAATRMRTSAKVATNLFGTLHSLRDNVNFELATTISYLKNNGANASQIIDAIIDGVCPNGGSLDEVSCKDSGTAALSEFMERNPNADISNLSDDQIWMLTSNFLGNETFSRIQIDIGQIFEKQEIPYLTRISRLNEMREFIQSEISTQINKLRVENSKSIDLNELFRKTIKNTFEVYEVEV